MKAKPHLFPAAAALSLLSLLQAPTCLAESPYRLVKEIPVGGEGRWDYLCIDEGARRLYVTHESRIEVVDLEKEQPVGQITNTPGVHGFAVAPIFKRGFATDGPEGKMAMVDLETLKTFTKMKTGKEPDAILYEPGRREIYTFNAGDHSVNTFEADDGDPMAVIPLPGKPGFAAADPQAGRVYCNLQDKSEVAVIDSRARKVVKEWPVAPGVSPSGMAIDLANHRVFLGCANKLLVMMDSAAGKVLATVPIGEGVGAVAFDPATRLVFTSNGEGTVTIAHEDSPEKLTVVQILKTQPGAHDGARSQDPQDLSGHSGVRIFASTVHRWAAPTPKTGSRHL